MILKDIKGYEGRYQISDTGQVYSLVSKKYLKPQDDGRGYLFVRLTNKKGIVKNEKIHRLVAQAFTPNPDNLPEVNHIDENKYNNCVDNLEWCSVKYNRNYGTRYQRIWKTRKLKKTLDNGDKDS